MIDTLTHLKMKYRIIFLGILLISLSLANLPKLLASPNQQLLITEVGNHEVSDLEWIEIYNNSEANFDLNGLIFREEGVNHKTTLMQGSNILSPNQYALIVNKYDKFIAKYPELLSPENIILDSSWIILSNNGELLELNKGGIIYEQIIYSENHGNTSTERVLQGNKYINQWKPHPTSHSMLNKSSHQLLTELDTDQTSNDPDSFDSEEQNQEDEEDSDSEDNFYIEEINSTINELIPKNDDDPEFEEDQEIPNNPTIIYEEIITYVEKPFILISEVSFSSDPDWIEIFIDPRDSEVTLNNLQLEIDKKFLNLGLNGKVSKPSFIILETNLVATTEQISIVYNGKVYDSFCWNNGSAPLSEQIEEEILKEKGYWVGSCLNSVGVKKDETFFRQSFLPDTNTAQDFKKTNKPTKGSFEIIQNQPPTAVITIQSGKTTGTVPLSINLTGTNSTDPESSTLTYEWQFADQKITKANPDNFKFEKAGNHLITLTVTDEEGAKSTANLMVIAEEKPVTQSTSTATATNASTSTTANQTTTNSNTLSANLTSDANATNSSNTPLLPKKNIQLHAFMPNPKGADTETEWIEIINLDKETVDLKNYYIDDEEGGSKPFHLDGYTIKPNEIVRIMITTSKISLGNTKDKVRLLYGKEIIEEVYYETAKDDELFIKKDGKWQRTIPGKEDSKTTSSSESKNATTSPTTSNNSSNNKTSAQEEQSTQTSKSNILTASLTSENNQTTKQGTLSMRVGISEVFPNPKGADKGKEWIELFNWDEKDVNLNGWKLIFNKKEYKLDGITIKSNKPYVLKDEKLSIPNSNLTIQLVDFQNTVIDIFEFEKSKEDHSVFRYQQEYIWTKNPTPNAPNPERINIEGQITNLNEASQSFTLKSTTGETLKILYPNNLQSKIKENDLITGIAWISHDNKVTLETIENVTNQSQPKSKSNKILWTLLIPMLGVPAYYFREKISEIITFLSNQN